MDSVMDFCEAGWAVIAVAALNRTGYQQVTQAAFRDSSAIEYGGAVAYLIEPVEPDDTGSVVRRVRLKCVKNRNAMAKSLELCFDGSRLQFTAFEPLVPGTISEPDSGFSNPFSRPSQGTKERRF